MTAQTAMKAASVLPLIPCNRALQRLRESPPKPPSSFGNLIRGLTIKGSYYLGGCSSGPPIFAYRALRAEGVQGTQGYGCSLFRLTRLFGFQCSLRP